MASEFQIVDVDTLLVSGGRSGGSSIVGKEIEATPEINLSLSVGNRRRGQQVSHQVQRSRDQVRPTKRPIDEPLRTSCCQRCGKKYVRYQHLRRHIMFECGRMQGRFRCYFCTQTSKLKDNMKKHCLKRHYGEDFQYYLDGQHIIEPWSRGRSDQSDQMVELSP
ncbi:hypothetical protein QAD02_022609 [Eretmocerus hayati]|uniref:Uncharacterized protein n=1 Tax=Eretmocerus hayati TaxID=131215 RepID=A0ACC2PT84_9HYME|nr:hypothetical protein QAD02_022609 [Eretmocerus hayati]